MFSYDIRVHIIGQDRAERYQGWTPKSCYISQYLQKDLFSV